MREEFGFSSVIVIGFVFTALILGAAGLSLFLKGDSNLSVTSLGDDALIDPIPKVNKSFVVDRLLPNPSSRLPICPSATATNCRMVSGVTKEVESWATKDFSISGGCVGSGSVPLSVSPMNIADIGLVIPMGLMVGDHVTPIDHMYFQPLVFHSKPDTYDVYANADGVIHEISVEPLSENNKYKKIRLVIRHTCDFYSIYNLLTSLSPQILKVVGEVEPGRSYRKPIKVKVGDLLGKIGGQTLDLSVNYDKVILPGFLVPEHYAGEAWKIHTVDPFDYFIDPVKSQLLAKNPRQVSPRGGKIDYDIDGRLVGNWFIEGSGGYPLKYIPDVYKNHVSFAYDEIDPTHVIVSFGNFFGEARQFSVRGNPPDPKDISLDSGIVKYELVETEYVLLDGSHWDRFSYSDNIRAVSGGRVMGVALVQMISDRKMKLQFFLNQTEAIFDEGAVIYER